MKQFSFLVLWVLISIHVQAQESGDKKIFLDSINNEVAEGSHTYYRIIRNYFSENKPYKVQDYYKSGNLRMEGYSLDKDRLKQTGDFVCYYPDGEKKSQCHFENSAPVGKYYTWYENGNPEYEGEYFEEGNSKSKIFQYWDSQNNKTVIDGNGYIKGLNSFYGEGSVKNGYREGEWKSEFNHGKGRIVETYVEGKFISGVRTDQNNVEIRYDQFEKKPEPKKGMKDFYEFIGNNFKYSKEARKENIKGRIIVTFVVDEHGNIVEPKILKGVGYGLDEEAIRVVQKYEKWIPGEQRGVKVRCNYSLPIALSGSQ